MKESLTLVAIPRLCRFASGSTSLSSGDGFVGCGTTNLLPQFSGCRCLLARILHALGPIYRLLSVPNFKKQLGGNKVNVMHLVAGWTENHQVLNLVIRPVAVDVRDFKNLRNTKAAKCTNRRIV